MKKMMAVVMIMMLVIEGNSLDWKEIYDRQRDLRDIHANNDNKYNKNNNNVLTEENDNNEDNEDDEYADGGADNDDEENGSSIFNKIYCEDKEGGYNSNNRKNNKNNNNKNHNGDNNINNNKDAFNDGGKSGMKRNDYHSNNIVINNDNYYDFANGVYNDNRYENNGEDKDEGGDDNDEFYYEGGGDWYDFNKIMNDNEKDYERRDNEGGEGNEDIESHNNQADNNHDGKMNHNKDSDDNDVEDDDDGDKDGLYYHWLSFILKHDKVYQDKTEEKRRQKIFYKNMQYINKHNDNKEKQFALSKNEFSDLTLQEHQSVRKIRNLEQSYLGSSLTPLPQSTFERLDWREVGAVTTPKQQGSCGACYAFSVAGVVEGCHFRKTNSLVELSAQNILDCNIGNCEDGGSPIVAYQYVINNGIDSDANYPYEFKKDSCKYNRSAVVASINRFFSIKQSEEDLKKAVTYLGPLSVGIHSSLNSFLFYSNGIYNDVACTDTLNHDVLLVGFGQNEAGVKYWIIKNSWGESWGEGGYMYLARDAGNLCGISSFAQGATC